MCRFPCRSEGRNSIRKAIICTSARCRVILNVFQERNGYIAGRKRYMPVCSTEGLSYEHGRKKVVVKDLVTKSNLPSKRLCDKPLCGLPSWVQVLLCLFYEAVYEP